MKAGVVVVVFGALLLTHFCQASPLTGKIVRVLDGDSLVVSTGGKKYELRLYGIDSPEHGQPFSDVARRTVQKWTLWKKVRLETLYRDKYQRLVCRIFLGAGELSGLLVREGLAWVHPAYCHKSICTTWRRYQDEAREHRRGLWSEEQPVEPWRYKRRKAERN